MQGFQRKILQELHVRGWRVTEEMPSPESSPGADDAWDSGCHLRAQTDQGFIMRLSPCLLVVTQSSLLPPLTCRMLASAFGEAYPFTWLLVYMLLLRAALVRTTGGFSKTKLGPLTASQYAFSSHARECQVLGAFGVSKIISFLDGKHRGKLLLDFPHLD